MIGKEKLELEYVTNQLSARKIAQMLGTSPRTVLKYLSKHNIPIRKNTAHNTKYFKNLNFFNIPVIKNCYWAGFIAADGCLRTFKTNRKPSIKIVLNVEDRPLLEKFTKDCCFTGPTIDGSFTKPYGYYKKCKYFTTSVSIGDCEQWHNDLLLNWNITPKKSLTLQPPNLTELEHKLAYIIGYIDGDGCVSFKNNRLRLIIVGTKDILEWISLTLNNIEKDSYSPLTPHKHGKNCFAIEYSSKRAYGLLTELNKIETPYRLSRKWDKIKEYESKL